MKVLIADDHAVVRQGLKQILAELPDCETVGDAANAREVLEAVRKDHWDILILDMSLPDKNGLDVLKELKLIRPRLPVLFLSMHSEEQFAIRALKAGASGYLTKESAPEELVGAIRKALAGGKYLSEGLAERLASEVTGERSEQPEERLSDREYEVMRQIASGKTVSEIGKLLRLSVKTISTYRTRVLEKMQMKTNAELTRYAIQNKLV